MTQETVRFRPLHLLWALPLAGVVALPLVVLAGFVICGISGCSGGGFGRTSDPDWILGILATLASGLVMALPWVLVPWHDGTCVSWLAPWWHWRGWPGGAGGSCRRSEPVPEPSRRMTRELLLPQGDTSKASASLPSSGTSSAPFWSPSS